jgi:hypothetical protein
MDYGVIPLKRHISFLYLAIAICLGISTASAQYYPTFGSSSSPIGYSSVTGVAIASAPATTQASEVVAIVNSGGGAYVATSLDGISYTNYGLLDNIIVGSPTITVFNGSPYVAFIGSSNFI